MNFLQLLTVVIPLAFWNMLFTMYTIKRETKEINIKLKTLERDINSLFSFLQKQKTNILTVRNAINKNFFDINTNKHIPIDPLDSSNPPCGGSGVCLSNKLTYKGAIFKIEQIKRKEELELEGALEKYKKTTQTIMKHAEKEIEQIRKTNSK